MKRGRKTILTPALTKKLCASLASANSIATSCALSGIAESTFYDWQRRGENGEENFAEFSQSVYRARGESKRRLVEIIIRQSPDDWRAAAWILERGYRDEYGKAWRDEPGDLQPPTPPPQITMVYRAMETNGNRE